MIFAVLIALITAAVLYVLLFEDWDEFVECVKFCFTPDIISALRGKYWDDVWAETKILLWLCISLMAGVSAYFWLSVETADGATVNVRSVSSTSLPDGSKPRWTIDIQGDQKLNSRPLAKIFIPSH